MRQFVRTFGVALAVIAGIGLVQSRGPAADKKPAIAGAWVGTWGEYSPPKPG
jgi:hypothetical protein